MLIRGRWWIIFGIRRGLPQKGRSRKRLSITGVIEESPDDLYVSRGATRHLLDAHPEARDTLHRSIEHFRGDKRPQELICAVAGGFQGDARPQQADNRPRRVLESDRQPIQRPTSGKARDVQSRGAAAHGRRR